MAMNYNSQKLELDVDLYNDHLLLCVPGRDDIRFVRSKTGQVLIDILSNRDRLREVATFILHRLKQQENATVTKKKI